jgi:Mrp family chromosome partitioning ATPase
MSRHFEYLAKARGSNGQAQAGLQIAAQTYLPPLPADREWTQLVAQLWRQRSKQDELSIGVFPCGEAEDDGWFPAALALYVRQTLNLETLLIDLDSEHGGLAQSMHTPTRPGLSEFLNSAPVAKLGCVHETGWSGVFVLPQGGAPTSFDTAETERRLRWLHATVQRDFPVVITRFPRVNRGRTLRACWNIPEMAVLTVTPGVSRKSELRRDTKALRAAGANLIGLVFTGSSPTYTNLSLGVNP